MSLVDDATGVALKTELELRLPQVLFEQWFSQAEIMAWDGECLELGVQNRFYKSWIESKYMDHLLKAAAAAFGKNVTVVVTVSPKLLAASRKAQAKAKAEAEAIDFAAAPTPPPPPQPVRARIGLNLNPDFTFDAFAVGPANRLSHAVALRAVENPGDYSRIYICGQHGVGKTHLLQAICHATQQCRPEAAVAYVTADRFMSDFTSACASDKPAERLKEFRAAYRRLDLLAFDEFQALGIGSKTGTQTELLAIIDELEARGGQVVVAAAQPPAELEGVNAKLRDRLGAGFVDKLPLPDVATRRELIIRKLAERHLALPADAVNLMVRELTGNVRGIEGTVARLAALIQIEGMAPTIACIRMALEVTPLTVRKAAPTFADVIQSVADEYGIAPEALTGRGRSAALRKARQLAIVLCRRLVGGPYAELGRAFGGRTHATLISAERNLDPKMFEDGLEGRPVERILFRLGINTKPGDILHRPKGLFGG